MDIELTRGSLNNGAETAVASSAVPVIAANAGRKAVIIQNVGANNVRIGGIGVTATTGLRLKPDGFVIFEAPFTVTGAIYAVREGGSDSTVLAMEIT